MCLFIKNFIILCMYKLKVMEYKIKLIIQIIMNSDKNNWFVWGAKAKAKEFIFQEQ